MDMTKEDHVALVGVNIYNHLHRQNNTFTNNNSNKSIQFYILGVAAPQPNKKTGSMLINVLMIDQ